jgi:hypothetical protein
VARLEMLTGKVVGATLASESQSRLGRKKQQERPHLTPRGHQRLPYRQKPILGIPRETSGFHDRLFAPIAMDKLWAPSGGAKRFGWQSAVEIFSPQRFTLQILITLSLATNLDELFTTPQDFHCRGELIAARQVGPKCLKRSPQPTWAIRVQFLIAGFFTERLCAAKK